VYFAFSPLDFIGRIGRNTQFHHRRHLDRVLRADARKLAVRTEIAHTQSNRFGGHRACRGMFKQP
jgi:hypothetical protein